MSLRTVLSCDSCPAQFLVGRDVTAVTQKAIDAGWDIFPGPGLTIHHECPSCRRNHISASPVLRQLMAECVTEEANEPAPF